MKIGFNCSCFDLFHAGHVTMLKMEREMCDYLKVALQVDPTIDRPSLKNKPVQSIYERYAQVQACKYVNEILVYDSEADLLNLMALLSCLAKTNPEKSPQQCADICKLVGEIVES